MSLPAILAAALHSAEDQLPAPGNGLLVAVSGGCDSNCLLHWLQRRQRWSLEVAHLDHALREDSASVADAVEEQCRALGLRCHRRRIDVAAQAARWSCGIEEAGRRLRYAWFAELLAERGLVAVCCAHHRDDQAETVLGNLLRGAGPVGAAGMPATRLLGGGRLLRPWLALTRADIRHLATAWAVSWQEDPSNRDCRFRRNQLRHQLLPAFERACPGFGEELLRWSQSQAQELVDPLGRIDALLDALREPQLVQESWHALPSDERLLLWRALLLRLGCSIDRAVLRRFDDLARGSHGRSLHLGSLLFHRRGTGVHWETAAPVAEEKPAHSIEEVSCPQIDDDPWHACIDADAIAGTLTWRRSLPGERWQALGAPGHRSLRRWLGERGVPRLQRESRLLLADERGVIWVPGLEIAERVRVREQSRRFLALRCDPALPVDAWLQALPT